MPNSEGPVSTLHDYLDVLRRRKWVLLIVLAIGPALAYVISLRQPAVYQASAEVLLSRQTLATQLFNLSDPAALDAGVVKTQARLARTPEIAGRALDAVGLQDRSPSDLLGSSSVSPAEETDILVFTVRDNDPKLAARLATQYAKEFATYRRSLDVAALADAGERVQERIEALEARGNQDSVLYRSLVDTRQQIATMEALQSGSARVVRSAAGAVQIEPQPRSDAMVAFALALVLGVTIAFLAEALDSRIRTSGEAVARLQLPLLARVPARSRRERRRRPLAMLAAPNGRHAEPFRMLRTKLELNNLDRDGSRIMVTSAGASEGKSTTVANLAVALARAGRRVTLVDLDLRRPGLHKLFDVARRPGVTDVLLGHAELHEALARVPITLSWDGVASNGGRGQTGGGLLEVLSSGTDSLNPGELTSLPALINMLERLSRRADLVLIDAPPLLVASETLALASRVHALIFVALAHVVRAQALDEARDALDACPTVKLGLVLTGTREGDAYHAYYGDSGVIATPSLDLLGPDVQGEAGRRTSKTPGP